MLIRKQLSNKSISAHLKRKIEALQLIIDCILQEQLHYLLWGQGGSQLLSTKAKEISKPGYIKENT